jgi:hypothetical protein
LEDGLVEDGQSVREDEVLKDPSDFSAHIKNVVSDGNLFSFVIAAVKPTPAQEIKGISQGGQKYGDNHHIAIIKVVHLKLNFDKKRRHFGYVSIGLSPRKVNLIVAIGVLKTVEAITLDWELPENSILEK